MLAQMPPMLAQMLQAQMLAAQMLSAQMPPMLAQMPPMPGGDAADAGADAGR